MNEEKGKRLEKLGQATRMLVKEGALDAFGHVSVRCSQQSEHYYMLRTNRIVSVEKGDFVELDKESLPVLPQGPKPSIERFIHGEIYRARPDVGAIVHTHAPDLIPFGVTTLPLKALYHMCGFLAHGVPVFDRDDCGTSTDMLITSQASGKALADCLRGSAIVLMRGHGATVVGGSLEEVIFRTLYTIVNAQMQITAMRMGGVKYLSDDEGMAADDLHRGVLDRPWDFLLQS